MQHQARQWGVVSHTCISCRSCVARATWPHLAHAERAVFSTTTFGCTARGGGLREACGTCGGGRGWRRGVNGAYTVGHTHFAHVPLLDKLHRPSLVWSAYYGGLIG